MHALPPTALIAFGVITAALIAGSFSYLNLVMSKEQKVSEFRQIWIDSLRKDIADYCAAAMYLSSAYDLLEEDAPEKPSLSEYLKAVESQTGRATYAYTSIILRINPADKSKELKEHNLAFLDVLERSRNALREDRFSDAKMFLDDLQAKARPILKLEWNRVRDGEPIFRLTRWVALAIILGAIVMTCYMVENPIALTIDGQSQQKEADE
ncbi:hypothetical protein [Xanthomonas arboricola]|uniref:hypothetical protein n=1 Tax=Xanthomonas arboricola TaxID=56448 RepID=UPI000F8E8B2D|nr:hypothetical protein [Xanthomonas arboricola]